MLAADAVQQAKADRPGNSQNKARDFREPFRRVWHPLIRQTSPLPVQRRRTEGYFRPFVVAKLYGVM